MRNIFSYKWWIFSDKLIYTISNTLWYLKLLFEIFEVSNFWFPYLKKIVSDSSGNCFGKQFWIFVKENDKYFEWSE
jgi:hypothetical protein